MLLPLLLAATVGAAAPIDPSGFYDATHHWRKIKEPERVMQPVPDQPSYEPAQVREIADNVLLFQRANGGWPKDYDMLAILNADQKQALRDSHAKTDTTFDNHTTHSQIDYLARAFVRLGDAAYRDACLRGFDYLVAQQYPHGGFPQRTPGAKGIAGLITFNDGVMIGCLGVLRAAAERQPHFVWLDEARRARAADAVQRGIACLLRCQIKVGDRLTGWGQQHDPVTFETVGARTFELACIAPGDTAEVVEFLLGLPQPTPEIVRAVDAAVAWLRKVKLTGIRIDRVPAPRAEFVRHSSEYDVVVVPDAKARPLWARMVEVGSDRPIFASRDGIKRYSLAEVDRERRTGSGWYLLGPERVVERAYPKWQAARAAARN
jgi:PelA/Pel-15E family pectate lyase